MEKPILATNIDGFLINHSAFIEPHKAWFERAIKMTGDESLREWIGKKDYFKGVDIAMEKIMPQGSPEQRTLQARHWYQEDVVNYIKQHPEIINKQLLEVLKKQKERFTLALITTNTNEYIHKILEAAKLQGIYDIIFATSPMEKPDKGDVFQRFVKQYGSPKYYIATRSKEAFEECKKIGSICIYLTLDEIDSEIEELATRTIRTPTELELLN